MSDATTTDAAADAAAPPAADAAPADGAAASESTPAAAASADEPQEEESTYQCDPVVQLEEVEVTSGEEEEDIVFKLRGKLYRYGETMLDKGSGKKQWIERGVGEMKILKHRETQTERLLMRQEKTMKLIVNALVDPRIVMTKNVGSDRAWVWSCFDYSEGTLEEEVFSVKFGDADNAAKFKEAFDQSQKNMAALQEGADAAPSAEADEAADALAGLSTGTAEKES
mmetsp:Transcript_4150/g.8634  ORF Transcript_4150/g.8634 Transcript_4150/m.8634 type:complete len:226 (-) Transcript_4150:183-860(-)|eukprot:CAMPEP_0182533184 /NCGR_PEP_ID=MMETSP1323-20130603/13284_1 /TAXON_ID=236787 /ORGANISM="Florenciella parvula, Strain RCC1693" /LENGTH=225 /DNA_ID=CAMNT_0024743039 /DNA_START=40 /DNA_END=717 /DNA_ORIENTATION=-